ncbi:MAG TPA: hypothetical protein VGE09_03190 [Pseudoxanthomonas sp.]
MNTTNVHIEHLSITLPPPIMPPPIVLPATSFSASVNTSGPVEQQTQTQALEYCDLGDGKEISPDQALKEVEALASGGWRLESPHELFACVDYGHKNANGAYSRDESIKRGYYWTNQPHPEFEGARVVVGFRYGGVNYDLGDDRCFARAVRVARQ